MVHEERHEMTSTEAAAEAYAERLEKTLPEVRERIARAVSDAGREPAEVRLVAVTKGHPLEAIDAALAAGLSDLGENRVHELEAKVAARGREGITWHMIGHVQSRKARAVAQLADLVHSVDSVSLAERLSGIAVEGGIEVSGLAQVNTSGERSKGGFDAEDAVDQIHRIAELPGLRVKGLMTMAPFVDDEAVITGAFTRLREILGRLHAVTDAVGLELSMGMTNDLEIAIREGSTMVRIGTALFGPRA
jgi:pyridoxal phosphate enzyme (YggS family)